MVRTCATKLVLNQLRDTIGLYIFDRTTRLEICFRELRWGQLKNKTESDNVEEG